MSRLQHSKPRRFIFKGMKQFRDGVRGTDFIFPLRKFVRMDSFRSPQRPTHMGLDFCGEIGQEVLSSFPGEVLAIYDAADPGGKTVHVINRDDPKDPVEATYSHLDDPPHVKVGDKVSMGQVLGTLAAVPKAAPRPHVHYQMRRRQWLDPEIELGVPKTYP